MTYTIIVEIRAETRRQANRIVSDMVEAAAKLDGELIDSDVQDEGDDEIV